VAATDRAAEPRERTRTLGSFTLAALALPGVMAMPAQAESPPESAFVAFKIQAYNDWQPGLDRIKVVAPSIYVLAPFAGSWSIESTLVHDSISGCAAATPQKTTIAPMLSRLRRERGARTTIQRGWQALASRATPSIR
jgi:hypothetical protein